MGESFFSTCAQKLDEKKIKLDRETLLVHAGRRPRRRSQACPRRERLRGEVARARRKVQRVPRPAHLQGHRGGRRRPGPLQARGRRRGRVRGGPRGRGQAGQRSRLFGRQVRERDRGSRDGEFGGRGRPSLRGDERDGREHAQVLYLRILSFFCFFFVFAVLFPFSV